MFFIFVSFLFWSSNAFQVFSITIATVIGPTPPGTGEIQFVIGPTVSKSTSPRAKPFTNVHPTSTTTVSGFTMSRVINPGFPIATTRISAVLVISPIFVVLLLQMVTVAQAFIAMRDIGFPTILERPRITTCFPSNPIL